MIPMAARYEAWVVAARLLGLWVRIPPGMDICLLWLWCVVRKRFPRRAYHSPRGVLPSVMVKRRQWRGPGLLGAHVKKNQLDSQLILSIFCQPLHVSGVSRPIIRRYNRMCTTIGTYYSFFRWLSVVSPVTTDSHLKRIISTNCCTRVADKSLARPTSRYILFDGENISFDASLVLYI